ncbi:CapA family protein [Lachnospiraceae bacterium 62-35]
MKHLKMRKYVRRMLLSVALGAAVWGLFGCKGQKDRKEGTEESLAAAVQVTHRAEEETAGSNREDEEKNLEGSLVSGDGTVLWKSGETEKNKEQKGRDAKEERQEVKLLFGGDVFLSSHVLSAYESAGGIHGVLDQGYRDAIETCDFFMVNEEFPFSSRGVQAEDKQFTFRLSPEKVSLFQEMGIDGVSLANNHALDFGTDALLDTVEVLDKAGILHTGAGENLAQACVPVTIDIHGIKTAVIGATRVIPEAGWAAGNSHPGMLATYDASILLGEIENLRSKYDYIIVFVHWGIEREEIPQEYQRTLGRQYIDAGADMVIGSHPHVLQGIEYYKGKPIIYSLGNFVFGSSIPKTVLLEVTLPARLREEDVISKSSEWKEEPVLRILPGTSGNGYTRSIMEEEKQREIYQYLEDISFGIIMREDGTICAQ